MKTILLVLLVLIGGCNNPTGPTPIRSSDIINYRVIGTNVIGNALIDYSTPTGVVSWNISLTTVFNSGNIIGFSQFTLIRPSLNVSILNGGCIEAQILVNAIVERVARGCGPITITVTR